MPSSASQGYYFLHMIYIYASRQTHKVEINEYFIKNSECSEQGGIVGTSYNSSTHKAEAEESGVQGQPGLEDPILNW